MIAELSVVPLDSPHMSREVKAAVDAIKETGVPYQVGAMSTCVEGDWDQIIAAARHAHDAVARRHARVLTTITIDSRKDAGHSLHEAVEIVAQAVPRRTRRKTGHSARPSRVKASSRPRKARAAS